MNRTAKKKRLVKKVTHPRKKSKRTSAKKNSKASKIFIYALAVAALGGGGYLLYDRIKRKKSNVASSLTESDGSTIIINNSLPASYTNSPALPANRQNDAFPLKRGSRGANVRALQQALLKTSPTLIVDGQFGVQTATALTKAGLPEIVDASQFANITSSDALHVVFNPALLAQDLYKASQGKNLPTAISILVQIKSPSEYSAVNEYYKKQSFISKTIVTDLLDYSFQDDELAQEQIRKQFLRIGLKVNSSGTWSLQGVKLYRDLITITHSVVTDSKGNKIPVRKSTILGDEINVQDGMTWFRSVDNSVLKVPTQDVKYI